MSAVVLIAFWVLFPRQPAFRDPANLSAKDALSVAYLRVLVQSDPRNAPLRLSFVQVLPPGVYIAMNGRIWHPGKVRKNVLANCFEAID